MQRETAAEEKERYYLECVYGQVWNTSQVKSAFLIYEFQHRRIRVSRKADGKRGTLLYQEYPRFYFSFLEEKSTDGT